MTAQQKPAATAAVADIDDLIAGLDDWRGELPARIRRLILDAVDGVQETWKWMGSPVWAKDGGGGVQRQIVLTRRGFAQRDSGFVHQREMVTCQPNGESDRRLRT